MQDYDIEERKLQSGWENREIPPPPILMRLVAHPHVEGKMSEGVVIFLFQLVAPSVFALSYARFSQRGGHWDRNNCC